VLNSTRARSRGFRGERIRKRDLCEEIEAGLATLNAAAARVMSQGRPTTHGGKVAAPPGTRAMLHSRSPRGRAATACLPGMRRYTKRASSRKAGGGRDQSAYDRFLSIAAEKPLRQPVSRRTLVRLRVEPRGETVAGYQRDLQAWLPSREGSRKPDAVRTALAGVGAAGSAVRSGPLRRNLMGSAICFSASVVSRVRGAD